MRLFKNTNYDLNHSILITFLILALVSCKPTQISIGYTPKPTAKSSSKPSDKNSTEGTKAHTVITTAKSYLGTHYKYGGCSRSGIDCSGLTYTSFKSVNIELPRTADEQCHKTKEVNLHDLKPGDLVFFTDKKGHSKITHVGIVTEIKSSKEVKFIHSSTHAGVIEENLYSSWYMDIFIKGGRIL